MVAFPYLKKTEVYTHTDTHIHVSILPHALDISSLQWGSNERKV